MNFLISSLQSFMTLIETENFTQAAEKGFMTNPTLTKIIQRLENNLGEKLLIRNNQKVELTQAGQ
ncbi:LysR family transcriptional regulator [Shewanella psychromarinicola]|uniref:LysR family transcriptional regulator n=1 Tax=Shewanella psychromarinicola TaxID=2487742 RepID=A0A3N4DDI4_9GAMM|nr:LysR family transcriptional regulator [Shewanella psychromarinicola]RPA22617.1 LysR family transcriptional regulator [Shewanella psychromarinicola]